MSHTHPFALGQTRSTLVGTFGSDFRHLMEPFKAELAALARDQRSDLHRAAMRLLLDYRGRRPTAMEQQLILAALAELQTQAGSNETPAATFDRVTRYCDDLRPPARVAASAGEPGS